MGLGEPRVSNRRVLVVGTTSDYIHGLCERFPGRALFLTDRGERAKAAEPPPEEGTEVLCDLAEPQGASAALHEHLRWWGTAATGIACFDDESMALAASLAVELSLPYVPAETIAACRSKFLCKQIWQRAGLPCPEVELVHSAADALAFLRRIGRPVVLKPVTGSGSELTFLCVTEAECAAAFQALEAGLAEHPDVRMYAPQVGSQGQIDPRQVFAIEEFVQGSEYSCDFILDGDRVQILRVASKTAAPEQSFGTTLAYRVPADLPSGLEAVRFRDQLCDAARALGARTALCMVDFVVRGDQAVMLEMAPRPGGDCLPPLLLRSCGLDMLGVALDFAEERPVAVPVASQWRRLAGLRLFAARAGVVSAIDARALLEDRRVLECRLTRRRGHRIELPPRDYESRLLGYVIFEPTRPDDFQGECIELAAQLTLDMEPAECATPTKS